MLHQDERTDGFLDQGLIGFWIAEEVGDVDQHLVKERLDLLRVILQVGDVFIQVFDQADFHAPLDPPEQGVLFVQRKVVPGFARKQIIQFLHPAGRDWYFALAAQIPQRTWWWIYFRISSPIFAGGRMKSTSLVAMALRGISSNSAVSGSWAMVSPPSALMVFTPRLPSLPVPESTMPMARSP